MAWCDGHMPSDVTETTSHWYDRTAWEGGATYYTFFLLPASSSSLAAGYDAALAGHGFLDAVPAPWLHLTLQGVGRTDEVDGAVVGQVAQAVAGRVADAAVGTITADLTVADVFREGVIVSPVDPEPFARVRRAVRAGITDVLGTCPGDDDGFWPHLSVAYANGVGPVAPVVASLSQAPRPEPVVFREVTLVELHREPPRYWWTTVAEANL
jgi:2'-5' RNA ligase